MCECKVFRLVVLLCQQFHLIDVLDQTYRAVPFLSPISTREVKTTVTFTCTTRIRQMLYILSSSTTTSHHRIHSTADDGREQHFHRHNSRIIGIDIHFLKIV